MARWGDEKTLNFICLYRDHDCLWNVHSPMYKNKLARENAYHSLITSFGDSSLTLKSVKIKIKNLRTIYHSELKKVKDSIRSEEGESIYKPSLSWFNEMHSFLSDSVEYRENITNEVEKHDDVADNWSDLSLQDAAVDRSNDTTLQSAHKSSHTNLVSPSKPNSNDGTISSTKSPLNPQSIKFKEHSIYEPKLKQRKLDWKRRHENDDAILNVLQRLEHISSAVNSTQQTLQDEFHFFALSVAAQLRTLPLRTAVETQSKIQSVLSAARLSSIPVASSSSCINNSPDRPANCSEVQDTTNSHGISIEIIGENIKQESDNESQVWGKTD